MLKVGILIENIVLVGIMKVHYCEKCLVVQYNKFSVKFDCFDQIIIQHYIYVIGWKGRIF